MTDTLRCLIGLLLACLPAAVAAQCDQMIAPASAVAIDRSLLRIAELNGWTTQPQPAAFRASSYAARGACVRGRLPLRGVQQSTSPISFTLTNLSVDYSSAYPYDRNNGITWTGRGTTVTAAGGARVRWWKLSAAALPLFSYATNDSIALASTPNPYSRYGYPWLLNVDVPQRMGPGALTTKSMGDSYARIDLGPIGIGYSNESVWWGPQQFFPLLMSNTAGGFKHGFLATNRPIDIGFADLTFDVLTGAIPDTEHGESWPADGFFSGLAVGLEPHGVPGLSIGAGRTFSTRMPAQGLPVEDWLLKPYRNALSNLGDNQLLSVFGRWLMPEAGFEVYGELARDDHWDNAADLLKEPDHSLAFGVGFSKVVRQSPDAWRVFGELVHLESAAPFRSRTIGYFYTNAGITTGHTSRGQWLGSWVGTGANAQRLGAERTSAGGQSTFFVQRVRYNADAYYDFFAPRFGALGHDLEFTVGNSITRRKRGLAVSASAEASRRWNRNFIPLQEDRTGAEWNAFLQLALSWSAGK